MSVPSLSFEFGDSKSPALRSEGTSAPSHEQYGQQHAPVYYVPHHQAQRRAKRRLNHDEQEGTSSSNVNRVRGHHRITKTTRHHANTFVQSKKHKSLEVVGEPLPLQRLVESLDHQDLQKLMKDLIDKRPDIVQELVEMAPKISVDQTLKLLNEKVEEIAHSLPYKVDPTSDYSYLRVQKLVVEFFNSFSDYILNFLAPVEKDITITLKFLNEFLMNIFHKIPVFQSLEFKFFYDLSVEKLNLIFVSYLTKFLKANKSNILVIIKDDWLAKVGEINKLNHLKFSKVYGFLKQEIELFEQRGYYHDSDVEDEIEDDKSAMLRGLNNLINFSESNSPLIGNVVGDSSYLL